MGDTTHLTTVEHGAYLLLLIAMWRTPEKRLINEDKRLARYAKLTPQQWSRMRRTIMEFFRVEDGHINQGRLSDEAIAVKQHSHRQSNKAKSRWLKEKTNGHAVAMPDACPTDASLTLPLPIKKEDGASAPKDPLWGTCLDYISSITKDTEGARRMIGRWRSDYGPEAALEAIFAAKECNASGPIAYISKCLSKKQKRNGGYTPLKAGGG